ncbi:unnamed protein product [Moneuplotes crassus]|uniref:RanBP2-type domain-containing protein n=1 Tax=Euplotes crassus TaxID=5936 RepID=A0AAD1Y9L0_EUPCR|nr:unnamed protein product [Moneuplotes crassus]
MEDMRNNLKSVVTSNLESNKKEEKEGNEILALLNLFINTKITNSFLILASCKASSRDSELMKTFKIIIKNTKDLSYIQNRHLQVSGAINSIETLRSEKAELGKKLEKLGKLKSKLENDIFKSFLDFKTLLHQSIESSKRKYTNFLPYSYKFLLESLHSGCVFDAFKEEKKSECWISPYTEVSKMARFSFKVEYNIGRETKVAQLDLPLVYKMNIEEMTRKPLPDQLENDIRRYALKHLVEQGVSQDSCEDLTLRIVNQPEIFALEIEGSFEEDDIHSTTSTSSGLYKPKTSFRSTKPMLDLFCKIMNKNDFIVSDLFKICKDDKRVKEYYPKHIVLWNTEYSCSEVYTLQAFKYEDHRGKQCVQGFYSGTYNLKEDVQDYSELFDEIKHRDVYPTLIIFECYETLKCEVEERKTTGSQFVKTFNSEHKEDKYTYEHKEEEDDFDYYSWARQLNQTTGNSGSNPRDDEWECEHCRMVNSIENYYCRKCFKDNDILKELYFQKKIYNRPDSLKYESRKPKPIKADRGITGITSTTDDRLTNTFKPRDRFNELKVKWTCRLCGFQNSPIAVGCESCHKLRENCDIKEPHCKECLKALNKKIIPKCKDCRAKEERKQRRISQIKAEKKVEINNEGSLSFQCKECYISYSRPDWIPMSKGCCQKCGTKKIFRIKCDLCQTKGTRAADLIGHPCVTKKTTLHSSTAGKRNTLVGTMSGMRF